MLRCIVFYIAMLLPAASGFALQKAGEGTDTMNQITNFLQHKAGSRWQGQSELWLDPLGNEALESPATLVIHADGIDYSWQYQGKNQAGRLTFTDTQASWHDIWHQPDTVKLQYSADNHGIFSAWYAYPAPPDEDWYWRIQLAQRPDDTLVLQMTNIAPWGEETRAVRMLLTPLAIASED